MPRSISIHSLTCNSAATLTTGILTLVLVATGHSQQTQSPNFGQPKTESKGNWLTNRLPWKNGAVQKPGSSKRTPIQHRDVSPQERRIGQFSLARLAEKRGQTDAAVKMYKALIQKNPKEPGPYHRLGVILAKKGDYKSAAEWLVQARNLAPRDAEILRDMGYLYYKNGRLDDAEKLYQQGLQFDANNQGLVNNYAMLLAEKQQFEQSLELFESVNKPAEAHANMGFIFVQMGHLDKAESYFNQALTLDKDLKSAAHGLIKTAQLKSQVESLRKNADLVAAANTSLPIQASLSDEPAAASRIATAPAGDSRIKQVAVMEAKNAPPAVRINPIRSGAQGVIEPHNSRQLRVPSTPIQSKGRQAVEAKPGATKGPATGPARQRNTLRIGSSTSEPIPTGRTAELRKGAAKNTPVATTATDQRPGTEFHWSTNRFPTSQPTWTPNPAKTEVPE